VRNIDFSRGIFGVFALLRCCAAWRENRTPTLRHIRRWVKNYLHYRYMVCSWLYCWLDVTKYTRPTPLLPLWYRCDLDSPFLSWVFCHKNMETRNFICTKEEKRAVIHFCGLKVYQVSKCIEWCPCSMGTVSCYNGLSVNGARGSKMVAQALSMWKEPDTSRHPLLMQILPTLLKTRN
jgi:hypothetical protein